MKTVKIEYAAKSGFSSALVDGVCHKKTLPYLSVVQAVEGSYTIALQNEASCSTGNGGFFIAPSNVLQTIVHHANPHTHQIICRWVFLKVTIDDLYDMDRLFSFPVILPQAYKIQLNEIFDTLFRTSNPFDEYVCYYQIVKILSAVSTPKTKSMPVSVMQALDYIKNHFPEKITVQTLADQAGMSESGFFACFKKEVGLSPIAYLNNLRLSIACDLLLNSNQTISDIAAGVGISDAVYFNKLFKRRYAMSPSKYRNMQKSLPD